MLAALLAVFLQALVVQTHVDGLRGLVSAPQIEASDDRAPPASQQSVAAIPHGKAEIACPICQASASAGRALLAARIALFAPPRASQSDAITRVASVVARPSHAWQSRAPPLTL